MARKRSDAGEGESAASTEQWIYIGRRQLRDGTLCSVYLDPQGQELNFAGKLRGGAIGARYSASVLRSEGKVSVIGTPDFIEPAPREDQRVGAWEAEDRAAYTAYELKRTEQKAQRDGRERFAALTLAELKTIYRRQTPARAAALLAQMLRYLTGA